MKESLFAKASSSQHPPFPMKNSKPSRPVQTRKSTPRSKTGCVTCKIRRLKCGEERPSCYRCVKSGWHCDGYEHVTTLPTASNATLASRIPRTPPTSPTPTGPLLNPSMILPLSDQEQFYLQYFVKDVAGQLSDFWKEIALPESITTFSVRHAIVAIGALEKNTVKKCGRYQMDAVPRLHREFALQQYQKAIQGLRESIPNLEDARDIRAMLVSCIVLAVFDDFIGNRAFALQHMRYAREILHNSSMLSPTPIIPEFKDKDSLAGMFLRLDVQVLCGMGTDDHRSCIPLEPHAPNFTLPARLSSHREAHDAMCRVIWEGHSFFYHNAKYHLLTPDLIPPAVLGIRDHFIKQLFDLNTLLGNCKVEELGPVSNPLLRFESLRLCPTNLLIRLVSNFGAPETACDALLPQFNYILKISRDTMKYEALENPGAIGAETYSVEIHTVSPLLLVATKCRNPLLRREAIALLLSSHRREWMYDSFLAGQMGEWMMLIEEEGIDAKGYIPEHSRAWGESIELDLQGRKAKVTCRQNYKSSVTGEMKWRLREKHISW